MSTPPALQPLLLHPLAATGPAYVILRKLEYFRDSESERHLRDVAGIIRVSGETIDGVVLERLLDERGLRAYWQRAEQLSPG